MNKSKSKDVDDGTVWNSDFTVSDVSPGDEIDRDLVSRGAFPSGDCQLHAISDRDPLDDTHTQILYDLSTKTYIYANCGDRQSAWSQSEANWTVRDVGSQFELADVDIEEYRDYDLIDDDQEFAADVLQRAVDDIVDRKGTRSLSLENGRIEIRNNRQNTVITAEFSLIN
ncbi:hypothetical protein [Halorubrum distributum]|uniref:hypothetical protein n=1 Tax=Halorubrum distributum TaxID=29283 RepID=UPI001268B53E|nr:hypothetical protein [Halorubrum arcis]